MSNQPQKEIYAGKTALVFGAVLLAGFATLSTLAAFDRRDRATLERLDAPSAAGDPVVYHSVVAPAATEQGGAPAPQAALTHGGVPLFEHGEDDRSDGTMMKAGMDDSGKIPLYRRMRRGKLRGEFYVKLAPGKFLELAPAKAHKPAKAKEAETAAP